MISYSEILDGLGHKEEVIFDVYFYSENKTINQLHTVVVRKNGKLIIKDEYLKSKTM